jgi:hypothetical protein
MSDQETVFSEKCTPDLVYYSTEMRKNVVTCSYHYKLVHKTLSEEIHTREEYLARVIIES